MFFQRFCNDFPTNRTLGSPRVFDEQSKLTHFAKNTPALLSPFRAKKGEAVTWGVGGIPLLIRVTLWGNSTCKNFRIRLFCAKTAIRMRHLRLYSLLLPSFATPPPVFALLHSWYTFERASSWKLRLVLDLGRKLV